MKIRTIQLFTVLCLLGLVSACSTPIEAVTDFDGRFDFGKVRKIAIQPVDRTSVNAIKISDMQIERINQSLAAELTRRGFQVVEDNQAADAWMTWHLVTEERTDVRTYNSMSYYNCWRCGPNVSDVSVRQYTQGTFIVDMIDPARNQSVWRSIIESRLQAQPDQAKAEERRREAAAAIFAEFPPS